MRLSASDPDIQTLVTRIRDGVLDLQPDFQRQEVWSEAKKRRLIDSILREWHVPPIHVVVDDDGKENVLDGQQRLASIRDFVNGKFSIDGKAVPLDPKIQELDGKFFSQLPERIRANFNRFTIRYYRIDDYKPEEPGELFYRLNQPTNLTTAEQRNAFFGAARKSIKDLVDMLAPAGLTEERLGFSNARMAYDDVISRVCFSVDLGTLERKVTAQDITDLYRNSDGFPEVSVGRVRRAIGVLGSALKTEGEKVRLNKATLYSWLCFLVAYLEPLAGELDGKSLGRFIREFESRRKAAGEGRSVLLDVFNDKASSRVADTSSVLARDFILWFEFVTFCGAEKLPLSNANPRVKKLDGIRLPSDSNSVDKADEWVEKQIRQRAWGTLS